MDFKEEYQKYNSILSNLKTKCTEAEKQIIILETNLTNLKEQKKKLIEECEAFAGTTMDKIPELLNQKKEELDAIMSKLSMIDVSDSVITQDKLNAIKAITEQYSIS